MGVKGTMAMMPQDVSNPFEALRGARAGRNEILRLFTEGQLVSTRPMDITFYINDHLLPLSEAGVDDSYLAGYAIGRYEAMHDFLAHPRAFLEESINPQAYNSVFLHPVFYTSQFRRFWRWLSQGELVSYRNYAWTFTTPWLGWDIILLMIIKRLIEGRRASARGGIQ